MDRRETAWFNEIPKPNNGYVCKTVDYLDRLIGGREQKQYLFPQRRDNNKPSTQPKRDSIINNPSKNKKGPPVLKKFAPSQLDDTKWLEERKKRFPKVGANKDVSGCGDMDAANKPTHHDTSDLDKIQEQAKPFCSNNSSKPRKQTLFEKLMDSN